MSRYEFTRPGGYLVGTVEAPTADKAAKMAAQRFGRGVLLCTHLSDGCQPSGTDPAFCYGPDYEERDAL